MGLKLKPSKCRSLSITGGSSSEVPFYIGDTEVDSIAKEPHKFLGSTITFSGKQSDIFEVISSHFTDRLERIDKLLIRGEFKVRIYQDYLLPASRFLLTVHTLTSTNLDRLDAITRKYLKKWFHLPQSATAAVLHAPNFTNIKTIRHLYLESQTCAYISSRIKADSHVNNALDSRLEREQTWTRKKSTIVQSDNILKELKNKENLEEAKKEVKVIIKDEIKETWDSKIKTLSLQGQFLEILNNSNTDINWKSIMNNLPRNVQQFFLNSAIDTLPTNSNLVRWKKRSSEACSLCNSKETLLHSLNNCPIMLNQGRYTWRHNSVLNKLFGTLKSITPDSTKIYCDLPGHMQGISTVPTNVTITSLKPDLVLVDEERKSIAIIELTVPFDSNIDSASDRKQTKYQQLVNDIRNEGFSVNFYAFEISSRGLITPENSKRLKNFMSFDNLFNAKQCNSLKQTLQRIVIVCSYIIFYSKYDSNWQEPNFVIF